MQMMGYLTLPREQQTKLNWHSKVNKKAPFIHLNWVFLISLLQEEE